MGCALPGWPSTTDPSEISASTLGRTSMNISAQRSIMLAGTIAGLLWAAPVFAQTMPADVAKQAPVAAPTPPALPPGSPLIGRPEGNEAAAKLAPVAPPPLPAAAEIGRAPCRERV